jgi:hypothetical protein
MPAFKCRAAAWLACTLLATTASAASKRDAVGDVAAVVTQYVKTLGCAVAIDKRNIVRFSIDGEPRFVALYSLDEGCSGGSAMSRPAFAVIEASPMGGFYIKPMYSAPEATSDAFPPIIDRLFVRGGQLRFEGRALGPNDALCCASMRVEGAVAFRAGHWIFNSLD